MREFLALLQGAAREGNPCGRVMHELKFHFMIRAEQDGAYFGARTTDKISYRHFLGSVKKAPGRFVSRMLHDILA